jgi:hypothetical protein
MNQPIQQQQPDKVPSEVTAIIKARLAKEIALRTEAAKNMPEGLEREYTAYYHTIPNSQYVFTGGGVAEFVGGRFLTDDPVHILELDAEVARRNQYITKGEKKLTGKDLDPVAEIRRKAVEEYIAAQKVASNPDRDMGKSEQAPLIASAANSKTVGEVTAGSSS